MKCRIHVRNLFIKLMFFSVLSVNGSLLYGYETFKRISILPFRNTAKNSEFDWVGAAVSEMISKDVASVEKIHVVRRAQAVKVLKDKGYQYDGITKETAVKIGDILGTGLVLAGDYQISDDTGLSINVRIFDVEKSTFVGTAGISGQINELQQLEKLLVVEIFKSLDIKLSDRDKIKIFQIPSGSVKAVENNYRGILALESGKEGEAKKYFLQAAKLDPYYSDAKHNYDNTTATFLGKSLIEQAVGVIEKKKLQIKAVREMADYVSKNLYIVEVSEPEVVNPKPNNMADIQVFIHVSYNDDTIKKMRDFFKNLKKNNTGDTDGIIKYRESENVTTDREEYFVWYKEAEKEWNKHRGWYLASVSKGDKNSCLKRRFAWFGNVITVALFGSNDIEIMEHKVGFCHEITKRRDFAYGDVGGISNRKIPLLYECLDFETIGNVKEAKVIYIKTGNNAKYK